METENKDGANQDAVVSSSYRRKRPAAEVSADLAEGSPVEPPPAQKRPSSSMESLDDRSSGDSDVEILTPHISSTNAHTEFSTQWALRNFSAWQKRRNAQYPTEKEMHVPADVLTSCDPKLLNKWMALYASETRKQQGGMFSPKTIYLLLAGLLRHMRSLNPTCPNFLHPSNLPFKPLHDSLQNTFRELQANDAMSETKSAEPFFEEEEEQLWSSGALSTDTPKGLLHAVFFLNGINFGVIGAGSHRNLKLSQIKRELSPPRYVYTPPTADSSTETSGLMLMMKKKNKDKIFSYATVEKGNRCHVHVLDLYLQKIPPEAFEKDNFYLQPIKHFIHPPSSVRWFTAHPVGRNSLCRMVRDICADAGIVGLKTLSTKSPSHQHSRVCEPDHEPSGTFLRFKLPSQLHDPSLPYSTSICKMTQAISSHKTSQATSVNMSQKPPQNATNPQQPTCNLLHQQISVTQPSPDQVTDRSNPQPDHLQDSDPLCQQQAQGHCLSQSLHITPTQQPTPPTQPQQDHQEANMQEQDTTKQQSPLQEQPLMPPPQPEFSLAGSSSTTNHPNVLQSPQSTNNPSTNIQCPNPLHAIPQQLSFTNCQVVIYVTPTHPNVTLTSQ